MKKTLALILAFMLCLSLCGCGGGEVAEQTDVPQQNEAVKDDKKTDGKKDDKKEDKKDAEKEDKKKDDKKEDKAASTLKSAKYVEIIKSGKYYMEALITDADGTSEMRMARNGDEMGMTATLADGSKAGLIAKDGKNYIIDHGSKMVMITGAEVAPSASNMPAETLDTEGLTFVKSGEGEFLGKKLPYDEYTSASGAVLRFYLNGDKLAGIEAVGGDRTDVYEVTNLSASLPEDLFVVPAGYQQFDLASAGG